MTTFNDYEVPEHDYNTLAADTVETEEEWLDYNQTVLYEFLAQPKDQTRFKEAAQVLFAELNIVRPNKAKTRAMEHLLFNLALLDRDHPDYAIRHYRSRDFWAARDKTNNPYSIGHPIIGIIDRMTKAGYLRYLKGYRTLNKSRMSRMWPTQKLIDLIMAPYGLKDCPVEYHPNYALVRINDENGCYTAPVTAETEAMNSMLIKYNTLLSYATISVIDERGRQIMGSRPVYRVFNKADLSWGGRFYGGWYQNIKSHLRADIMINNEPTAELDYKSQHPYMLYGQFLERHYDDIFGKDDSPYTVLNQSGIPYPRVLVKSLFLTALNAESFNATWRAIVSDYYDDLRVAEAENNTVKLEELAEIYPYICNRDVAFKAVYDDFIKKHHLIKDYICTGIGRVLQRLDSDIAMYVISKLTDMGVVVLCIHDSFIVQKQYEAILRTTMEEAYYELGMDKSLPAIERKEKQTTPTIEEEEMHYLVDHNSDVFIESDEAAYSVPVELEHDWIPMEGHTPELLRFFT